MPRVSIVVPAYYSSSSVRESLTALRAQTFRDFEIILVNSSPEEETATIVCSEFPEVRFVQSPHRLLPHAARNHGVGLVRGELIVFTDPDCSARPDWLEKLVAAHDCGHRIVGGGMELAEPNYLQWAVHLSKFYWLLVRLPARACPLLCTANVLYSRSSWERIGPFDGDIFTGDALHSIRARALGFLLWFEPLAVVEHRHQGSFLMYVRQFFQRGSEFGHARAQWERWSRARATVHVLLTPIIPLLQIGRTARSASATGWGARFFATLPLQMAFRIAWSVGEAKSLCMYAARR